MRCYRDCLVADRHCGWNLTDFDDHLDLWVATESPPDDVRAIVAAWVLSRFDDPYRGMRRETDGHPNLWFGMVPRSRRADSAVYCSCLIFETVGTVRCVSIATLSWPA
jgi:hypothetical protein